MRKNRRLGFVEDVLITNASNHGVLASIRAELDAGRDDAAHAKAMIYARTFYPKSSLEAQLRNADVLVEAADG